MHHAYQPILALLKDALQMATDNYPEVRLIGATCMLISPQTHSVASTSAPWLY